jgi:hypothetical protein
MVGLFSGSVALRMDSAEMGRKGGKARAKNLSPEERTESARAAVQARWAKKKAEVAEPVVKKKAATKKSGAKK